MNNPEFTSMMNADGEDLGKVRTQLFLQNPTTFFAKAYDARGTGTGMGYLTMEQGIKLSALYEFAKEEVRSELSEVAQSGKPMTKDNTAALEWLNKELELTISQRDKASQRETFAKVWPEMLNEISTLMDPKTVAGPLLRQDTHSWLNEFIIKGEEQESQRQTGQGQGLGQQKRPELPGLGQSQRTPAPFPGDPRSSVAPLPPPIAPPVVTVEGGEPSQDRQRLAEQYYRRSLFAPEGRGDYFGYWASPGSLPPAELIKRGVSSAQALKAEKQSELRSIGAARSASGITVSPRKKVWQTTVEAGEVGGNWGWEPFGRDELETNKETAIRLFKEIDDIDAALERMKKQAENQTGAKIPGLGAEQR